MVDFVENKNNIIFEKDANLQKISRLITSNSKNLIYKTTNKIELYSGNTAFLRCCLSSFSEVVTVLHKGGY